ncbi:hypothetical protein SUGI_0583200 [Cryptomeria japonica]|nr:hypothetical protein SUGI_0583200 [Cryptomeria japonica]
MSTLSLDEARSLNAIAHFLLDDDDEFSYRTTNALSRTDTTFSGEYEKGHYRGVRAEEAAEAYDRSAFQMRGSKAILNFPANVVLGVYVDPFLSPPLHAENQRRRIRRDKSEISKENMME